MDELLSTIKKVKGFYKTLAEAEEGIERIKDLEKREAEVRATISELNESEPIKRLAQLKSELEAATARLGQTKAQVAESKAQADTELRSHATEIENAKREAREWEDKLSKARAAYEGFKARL